MKKENDNLYRYRKVKTWNINISKYQNDHFLFLPACLLSQSKPS